MKAKLIQFANTAADEFAVWLGRSAGIGVVIYVAWRYWKP